MKKLYSKRGFSLMELLVVVAIISILTAIALPLYFNSLTSARESVDAANFRTAQSAGVVAFLADDTEPGTYIYDGSCSLVASDASVKGYGAVDPDKVIQVVIADDGSVTCSWIAETDAT